MFLLGKLKQSQSQSKTCNSVPLLQGWTLDPEQNLFVCTHPQVQLPEHGRLLALDTAEVMEWPESLCQYAKTVCEGRGRSQGTAYAMRFTGSIVADFHNVLLIGGLSGCPYAVRYHPPCLFCLPVSTNSKCNTMLTGYFSPKM